MAFFPRTVYGSDAGFGSLFRLLDDFDNYNRHQPGHRHHRNHVPTFQPKFDVREAENAYELHGELAGMNKQDVHIEFTDPQTMLVRGRIERSYTAGTPPAGAIEGNETRDAIEAGEETPTKSQSPFQATVEDAEGDSTAHPTPATTDTEVEVREKEQPKKPADPAKYWVSERSIGEFARSFNFPTLIQQDGVTACLKDGVLNITVPKAKKHEARRIAIA